MTEITEPTLKLCWNEHAVRRAAEVLRAAGLQLMAEDVEAQFPKPAISEPESFGSVVRARCPGYPENKEPMLWQKAPIPQRHYWESETGAVEVWSELTDVEVLRVGLTEPNADEWKRLDLATAESDAYSRGYEDGAVSNLPSPVDRSNIYSVVHDRASGLSEDAAWDITDGVMKVLSLTDVRDRLRATVGTLTELKLAAVTAPEKRCYDMAASIVANLLMDQP